MPFNKHTKGPGRPKGSKNKEDLNSLRKLMEESFSANRLLIKSTIEEMLTSFNHQVKELNERIARADKNTDDYTSTLKYLSNTKSSLLEEFKWLMNLKAQLEPKEIKAEHTGIGPKQLTVIHNYTPNDNGNGRTSATEHNQVLSQANTSME